MKFALSYILVLVWFIYLISSGVYLFSRGFLLSRVSKTDTNSCRHLSVDPNDEYFLTGEVVKEIFKDVNASSNLCLPQKSKVIMLVIDALKYDFGVYKENLTSPLPYENKLSVLRELAEESREQTRTMRFKADPPTTTLQRLKGMTTGTLPTFVDIGSNFASPEINEDNIVDQMVKNGIPVVFLGDSTWTDLYPKRFKRFFSYPSFDIFDLDSIDRKVEKQLALELEKKDWQVLIAHFLGVDHCGHKHGPLHKEMARKLNEMNEVIRSVVSKMDDETTLLVMGDHGMTITGDHGGDSDDETNALLFAYTKKSKFYSNKFGSDVETLQQIDLVPTIATILGIPIPYSNLGLTNFNIIPKVDVPHMTELQTLVLHSWQNAQQIYNYFFNYVLENKRSFNADQLDRMDTEFILLTHRVKSIYTEAAFQSFITDLNSHLRQILRTCRELWVKFDPTQMSHGLMATFLCIFLAFVLIIHTPAGDLDKIFTLKEMGYTYLLNIAAGVFGYRYFKNFSFKTEEHAIIFFTAMISTLILVFHTVQSWYIISETWFKMKRFENMATRVILLILLSVFFSNSFVINEGKILSYLLVAIIMLMTFELWQKCVRVDFKTKFRLQQFMKSTFLKLFLASIIAISLIRYATTLFRCREEQGNCLDFVRTSAESFSWESPSTAKAYVLPIVTIVVYTTLSRIYLRSCGNLTGHSANVLMARYGPTIASICTGGHMLLSNSSIKNIERTHIDAMAMVVYTLLVIQIIIMSISPLMVYVLTDKRSSIISIRETDRVIPEIFRNIKQMYQDINTDRRCQIPVVYGLATIYSSVLISFGTFLALVLLLILDPRSCSGIVVCIAVGAIILSMHAILRYRTATSFETCIQPKFTATIGWFLLTHFCFFATSHQTTLSQIDWRAAFVGRTTNMGQSHFISGMLVVFNTFCGHILFSCMYGLLSSETLSIFALCPNLIKTNANREQQRSENDATAGPQNVSSTYIGERSLKDISYECVGFDMTRGELNLFENERIFIGCVFKLAMQLFILQGLKVFCSMLACTIHCRHLMVWKIFAPRFIYEGIATFVSLPSIVVGFLLILRIHRGIVTLICKINKQK